MIKDLIKTMEGLIAYKHEKGYFEFEKWFEPHILGVLFLAFRFTLCFNLKPIIVLENGCEIDNEMFLKLYSVYVELSE